MINPLEEFKTKKVKNLLADFYEANFVKAGVSKGIGEKIIEMVWQNRTTKDEESLKASIIPLFEEAKKSANSGIDEIDLWTLFDFSNVESFLDFGANKLRYLNEVGYKYPNIKRLVGIDVVPQSNKFNYPDRSEYYEVDENAEQFPIEDNSLDIVNIQFVFHHFPHDKAIDRVLRNCYKALRSDGRLILWEETFETNVDLVWLMNTNEKLGVNTSLEWMEEYYSFTEEQRWEFIIVNDWIINVNNKHMQWTGMYKKWNSWIWRLEEQGFIIEKDYNLGLRLNGIIKQGVHIIGEFRLITKD